MPRNEHEANIDYHMRRTLEEIFQEDETLSGYRVENQPVTETGWADLRVYDDLAVLIAISDKVIDNDTNDIEVHRRAREYALELNSKFFVISNIHHIYLYQLGAGPLANNILKEWNDGTLTNIKIILTELVNICLGRSPSDNRWFNFLDSYKVVLQDLSAHLKDKIMSPDLIDQELIDFRSEEKKIVTSFGMNYDTGDLIEREKIYFVLSKQAAYILLNKIFCYKLIRYHLNRHSSQLFNLPEIYQPSNPETIERQIEEAFQRIIQRVDYAPIFKKDNYFAQISFDDEMRQIIVNYINSIVDSDIFENISEDFVSDMYIHLIPDSERKRLGQIYTPHKVAQAMAFISIDAENNVVLDPACGSGTFLRSVYKQLEILKRNSGQTTELHRDILRQIWGIEINQFPAQLSMMNLALMKIESITDIVGIIVSDFFEISPLRQWLATSIDLRTGESISASLPLSFDIVIGNPPYIRQENISNINLIRTNLPLFANHRTFEFETRRRKKTTRRYKLTLDGHSDIYTYFIWNATFFLKNHGRLCFIIPNKWLDVGYGEEMKKFILGHFKLLSIISFKRNVFSDADVSTIILLLERESNEQHRNENIVRFLHIENPITNEDLREYTRGSIDATILQGLEEDDVWSNLPQINRTFVKQGQLDIEEKWSYRFLLQSKMLQILRRSHSKIKLNELNSIIEVNGGLRTGNVDFFFLNQAQIDEYGISNQYLLPGVKNGRSLPNNQILINHVDSNLILIPSDIDLAENPAIQRWIQHGELSNPPSRHYAWNPWWALPRENVPLFDIVIKRHVNTELHPYYFAQNSVAVSDGMQGIRIIAVQDRERIQNFLLGVLNSNYFYWQAHVQGRWEGAGDLQILVYEFGNIRVPNYLRVQSSKIDRIIEAYESFQEIFIHPTSSDDDKKEAKRLLDLAVLDSMNMANNYDIMMTELRFLEKLRTGRSDVEILNI